MPDTVNGLWIQGNLSSLEQLTIQSYIANGFTFRLWTYEPGTIKVPRYTEIRDAAAILPAESIFRYHNINIHGHGKGSYAGFSDIFRYKLLYEHGGIWSDMDMTCLRPFEIKKDYFFRYHHKVGAVGNFMKCPPKSDLMKWCFEHASEKVTEHNKDWMLPIIILNEGIQKFGLTDYIGKISNNDSFPEVARLLHTDAPLPSDWLILHWMNEELRRFELDKNSAIPDSAYGRLLIQYDVPFRPISLGEKWKYKLKLHRLFYMLVTSYHVYRHRSKNKKL